MFVGARASCEAECPARSKPYLCFCDFCGLDFGVFSVFGGGFYLRPSGPPGVPLIGLAGGFSGCMGGI
jgi:hypothetical protein